MRLSTWSFWILLTVFLGIILYCSIMKEFDPDEIEAAHTTWKIFDGERIYVDFFQHHHPFHYYLLLPVLAVFGESVTSIYVMRIVSFVMLASMLFVTYRLSIVIYDDRPTARLGTLMLASAVLFVKSALEIRPDVPQTLFALISILFIFHYFDKKQLRWLVLCSICLAVSFLFLQKAIFVMFLIGLLLLINVFRKNIPFVHVLIYCFAILICVAPYYIYLFCSGALSTYWTFNWLLNMRFLRHFTAFNSLGIALRTSTLLCIFYIWSLLKFTKTPNQIRIGWLSLGLIGSTFLVRAPYEQYFMIIVPLMAVIAANAIIAVFEKKLFAVLIVLTFGLGLPEYFLFNELRENNTAQIRRIEYVLSVTEPGDMVYDGNAGFNVFRSDIDFFWFSVKPERALATYQTITEYEYDIYELIKKHKPKVISTRGIENMQHKVIADYYKQSGQNEDFYIRTDNIQPEH